jgi:ribonuclease P protein component
MSNFKFPKSERLTNKKKFEQLFESGKTVKAFPFKLIYITEPATEQEPPLQLAFTVPKRSFKKAVDRNYIRRRMKEAFRLNNSLLKENIDLNKNHLYAILIYTNRDKMAYHAIEKAWKKLVQKLLDELQK